MRYLAMMLFALILGVSPACSVPDAGDLVNLRAMLGTPGSDRYEALRKWSMRQAAIKWLVKKDPNQRVMKAECREKTGGRWGSWKEAIRADEDGHNVLDTLVDYFLDSIVTDDMSYLDVEDNLSVILRGEEVDRARESGKQTQCRHVWSPGFAPDEVPQEMVNPSEDDIVKSLTRAVMQETPPLPGIPFVPLPALCPLAEPCPGDSDQPQPAPTPDTGDQ